MSGTYLGVDLGASSGRVMAGWLDAENRVQLQEIHRFENNPIRSAEALVWDFEGLMREILLGLEQGINAARDAGRPAVSIGIDSWAVDFGLVDAAGKLVGPVYHYRDKRNDGQMEKVFERVPREEVFQRTGIQFLPFNTIYQLNAVRETHPEWLEQARYFMMIADLVAWRLTGEVTVEYSNATTTQLFDPHKGDWSDALIGALALPRRIFPIATEPGHAIGKLLPELATRWNAPDVQVVTVATHDTGSAVVAVPATEEDFAYLSSGTWSLLGTELPKPNMVDAVLIENFTNEGGARYTYRLLKNIMGLWILQECRRQWKAEGKLYTWPELEQMAREAAYCETFDVDDPRLLAPDNMVEAIYQWFSENEIVPPNNDGELARSVLLSLAKCYAITLDKLELLTGTHYPALHVVGGGSQNELLCQLTAEAINRPVLAGPVEATILGNIGMQMIADGKFADLAEVRSSVAASFPVKTYSPSQ